MTPEHEKARQWREARGLSVAELADETGYAPVTIYWMERGLRPPNRGKHRAIQPWVWQRFKQACGGVEYRFRAREAFDWKHK